MHKPNKKNNVGKPKGFKDARQIRHKIGELIVKTPKDTKLVRKEIQALGISREKIMRWMNNSYSFVDSRDALLLREYFTQYNELNISTVEDLFVHETIESFAKTKGLAS